MLCQPVFPIATGYTVDALLGKDFLEIVVPEDREMVKQNTANRLKGKRLLPFRFRLIRKDGSIARVMGAVKSIQFRGKQAITGSYMKITERKKMEEALNIQRAYFQQLFDSSPDAIAIVSTDGTIIQTNRGFETLFGYSPEETKGQHIKELIIPESRVHEFAERIRTILEGKVFRKETVRRDKNGNLIDVSVLSYPISFDGKVVGAYVIYSNITERKKMEEALERGAENYRALFESIVIGTIVLDAETMKIVMANQAAAKIFGYSSPQEIIEVNSFELVPSEDKDRVDKIIRKGLFERDLRQSREVRTITKNGRQIWINATGSRIMHEGKLAGLISFIDITEQKWQSERLMMTDRLASLGELAAGTAHELNNPLTSIIGFSQLLMEKEVPDEIREDLKLIHSEAQRAASVMRNLLAFAGKQAPQKRLDRINSIIEDVLRLRAYEHKANGIEVEKRFDPYLPEVLVDYFQMQQVFLNIIINAEYFMMKAHNKGTLTITTRKQQDIVMVSFADDGPGIPPENLGRIFDPFFTTKPTGQGTGLGLSICHGIMTEHGGQIYARSQLGKGAIFVVELPIDMAKWP